MTTYKINSKKILFTQLGDEGVLFEIEKNEYQSLNKTMFYIVKGINEGKSQSDIVQELCEVYDIESAECEKSVGKVLDELTLKGIIQKQ